MNIVQSLWTLPMLKGRGDIYENRFHGGWMNVKYHLLSLAYSCLQLKKFYSNIELVTDEAGSNILINKMGLPYTAVTVKLDELNDYNTQLWALGKIYAYSIQQEPFLHVDGDVYIWEPFPEKFLSADLIAQNIEKDYPYYRSIITELREKDCYIPSVIAKVTAEENEVNAYNAGVFGGGNIEFFRAYNDEINFFLKSNMSKMPELQVGKLNAFFEQQLFYCMSKEWGLKVDCVTDTVDKDELDFMLTEPGEFLKAPYGVRYMHLYGGESKNKEVLCNQLEALMKRYYPEYYKRIIKICELDLAAVPADTTV